MKYKTTKLLTFLLWVALASLIITLFVSTTMRVLNLNNVFETGFMPPRQSIDYGYARQPVLTLLHILPGALFIVLGALQFVKNIRRNFIKIHRFMGRIYILLGLIVGITAIIMGFLMKFGGLAETTAVLVFSSYFLLALLKAYKHIRNREYDLHREWMIRGYAIGLAVATMRPIIGLFFAFTQIPFNRFFGYVFWIAFIIHLIVAEWWIRFTRSAAANKNKAGEMENVKMKYSKNSAGE